MSQARPRPRLSDFVLTSAAGGMAPTVQVRGAGTDTALNPSAAHTAAAHPLQRAAELCLTVERQADPLAASGGRPGPAGKGTDKHEAFGQHPRRPVPPEGGHETSGRPHAG